MYRVSGEQGHRGDGSSHVSTQRGNVRADAKLDNPKILAYSTKAKQWLFIIHICENNSEIYTTGIMTNLFTCVNVNLNKTGLRVRKGEAMLHTHTTSSKNVYRLYDFQGTIMPAAKDAEWLISVCLYKTGSSGYLGPDTSMRIVV